MCLAPYSLFNSKRFISRETPTFARKQRRKIGSSGPSNKKPICNIT